jgi:hypothetical protein
MESVDSDQRERGCVSRGTLLKRISAGTVSFAESIACAQEKWDHQADAVAEPDQVKGLV